MKKPKIKSPIVHLIQQEKTIRTKNHAKAVIKGFEMIIKLIKKEFKLK